jgi:hypothetical protein
MWKIIFVAQFSVTPQFQDRLFFRSISGKIIQFGSKFDNLTDSYFVKFCNVFSINHVEYVSTSMIKDVWKFIAGKIKDMTNTGKLLASKLQQKYFYVV